MSAAPPIVGLRLNLGCGRRKLEGFVNVDLRDADVKLDIVRDPWPWPKNTVARIESYHFIEHLTGPEGAEFLSRCHDVLLPGGVIAVECPDLAGVAKWYATNPYRARLSMYGWQQRGEAMRHKWGYCPTTIRSALAAAGFTGIEVGPGTDYHAAEEPCLRAEGMKP